MEFIFIFSAIYIYITKIAIFPLKISIYTGGEKKIMNLKQKGKQEFISLKNMKMIQITLIVT